MLIPYYPVKESRTCLIKDILHQFVQKSEYKLSLDRDTSIFLKKDLRGINHLRRFENSPFPLLSNIELFSSTPGEWNKSLGQYGLKVRCKQNDDQKETEIGSSLYLIKYENPSSRVNRYLKKRYKLLSHYRSQNEITLYWTECIRLLHKSWGFKHACLNNWSSRWYKEYKTYELKKLWNGLNKILNLTQITTLIQNVWIESPKGKYRQLGVPPKSWRLYLHILNLFLSYIYSPYLPNSVYDGFLFGRGCKSWWETLLWSPLLNTFNSIYEVDFSSGFPNLNQESLRQALLHDGLVPLNLVNLFMQHLRSPLKSSHTFPTFETYVEHHENLPWRESYRSVHMGLGFSPLFFVITQNWALKQHPILSKVAQKWYADDGSFYFNLPWIQLILKTCDTPPLRFLWETMKGQNPLISYLNSHPSLNSNGLRLCPKKSGLVKLFGFWLKPYKSLGLCLFTNESLLSQLTKLILGLSITLNLKSNTRGRGENPKTGRKSTLAQTKLLDYGPLEPKLNLSRLLNHYQHYFGYLMAKLYSDDLVTNSPTKLKCKKGSPLWYLQRKRKNSFTSEDKITIYNAGSKMNKYYLSILKGDNPSEYREIKELKSKLNPQWKPVNIDLLNTPFPNPFTKKFSKSEFDASGFKKYSELKLSKAQLEKYRSEFNLQFKKGAA